MRFEIPETLPLLPVRDAVVFPQMILPLFVGRDVSIDAIDAALAGDRLIALVTQRDPEIEEPGPEDLHRVGTVGMLMRVMRLPDGRMKVLVQGLQKLCVRRFVCIEPHIEVEVEALTERESEGWSVEVEALSRSVRAKLEELLPARQLPPEILSVTENVDDPGRLADLVASNLRMRVEEAQEVLEIEDPIRRLRRLDAHLRRELAVSAMQSEIQTAAREELSRSQREHFLREQMRAIQMELGDTDERQAELEELRVRIDSAGMNDEAHKEARRQLDRLERMHPDSSETHVVRSYLEWLVEVPWSAASDDNLDLEHARAVLERDHAYLDRVKERILEFLAVHKLRGDGVSRGPILCLVGPPGVGKTSLGRSVAQAMGREFARMSLGGLRDEAEIRGHRRTYVGALPGRLIQSMRQAGTINPVFLLDEVDKLGADYRGDPAAALLEVLDPEQNGCFRDHYLNVPYDLSRVLFIATANLVDPIPRALRDRMEILHLPGYMPEEKLVIARRYLVPRQIEQCGLQPGQISISRAAIRQIISGYTQEAGVRSLEREVGRLCRRVARQIAEQQADRVPVTVRNLHRVLGTPPILEEPLPEGAEPGIARGLAWTETGGAVLPIEATLLRGRGLRLTGQLGEVMKESAQAALSWSRCRLEALGMADRLARHEVHVHVPAGATPKDGPSAGVALATAILSLISNVKVRSDVAMTGEITLRGRVLPVGGVRAKSLAALRRGLREVILPRANRHDLDDIPLELARQIRFHLVDTMDDVLAVALEEPLVAIPPRRQTRNVRPARSAGTGAA
ncbi:MAG: endopeptidase La [Myxococcota bacterium]